MATTRPLNDNQTVWMTTYYGGTNMGTCYDLTAQISETEQVTATFTATELVQLIQENGNTLALRKPEFDKE